MIELVGNSYLSNIRTNYLNSSLGTTSKFQPPEECPVCYETDEELAPFKSCEHWVGKQCLMRSLELTDKLECPLCRSESDESIEYKTAMKVCRCIMHDESTLSSLPQNVQYTYVTRVCEQMHDSLFDDVKAALEYARACSGVFAATDERNLRRLRRAVIRSKDATFVFEQHQKSTAEGLKNYRIVVEKLIKNTSFMSITSYGGNQML